MTYLEAKAIDDALELFDLLMTTELVGRAERPAEREGARRHPGPTAYAALARKVRSETGYEMRGGRRARGRGRHLVKRFGDQVTTVDGAGPVGPAR